MPRVNIITATVIAALAIAVAVCIVLLAHSSTATMAKSVEEVEAEFASSLVKIPLRVSMPNATVRVLVETLVKLYEDLSKDRPEVARALLPHAIEGVECSEEKKLCIVVLPRLPDDVIAEIRSRLERIASKKKIALVVHVLPFGNKFTYQSRVAELFIEELNKSKSILRELANRFRLWISIGEILYSENGSEVGKLHFEVKPEVTPVGLVHLHVLTPWTNLMSTIRSIVETARSPLDAEKLLRRSDRTLVIQVCILRNVGGRWKYDRAFEDVMFREVTQVLGQLAARSEKLRDYEIVFTRCPVMKKLSFKTSDNPSYIPGGLMISIYKYVYAFPAGFWVLRNKCTVASPVMFTSPYLAAIVPHVGFLTAGHCGDWGDIDVGFIAGNQTAVAVFTWQLDALHHINPEATIDYLTRRADVALYKCNDWLVGICIWSSRVSNTKCSVIYNYACRVDNPEDGVVVKLYKSYEEVLEDIAKCISEGGIAYVGIQRSKTCCAKRIILDTDMFRSYVEPYEHDILMLDIDDDAILIRKWLRIPRLIRVEEGDSGSPLYLYCSRWGNKVGLIGILSGIPYEDPDYIYFAPIWEGIQDLRDEDPQIEIWLDTDCSS